MTAIAQTYSRQADQTRRDELITSHLPLVRHIAGRLLAHLPAGADVENLEAAGVLGLVEAAAKYESNRNTQFKTFAYIRIRGAMLDELRRNSPLPQQVQERVILVRRAHQTLPSPVTVQDLAAATGLTPDEVSDALAAERVGKMTSLDQSADANGFGPTAGGESPEEHLERWETVQQLADAIEQLPPKERLAVTLYYREELRLKEIAEVMRLSPSRISRLISKATFELQELLRARLGREAAVAVY